MRRPRQPQAAAPLADLPPRYWTHLRGVHRACDPAQSLDHVLVGPSGIYVVRYAQSGTSTPAPTRGGHRVPDDLVTTSAEDAGAVRGLLPLRYRDRVRPVLCLLGTHDVAEEVSGVLVASLDTFEHIVTASRLVLSTSEARAVWSALREDLDDVAPAPAVAARRSWVVIRAAAATLAATAALVGALVVDPGLLDAFGARG